MKIQRIALFSTLALLVLVTGCAEKKDPVEIDAVGHPDGWGDRSATEFHGAALVELGRPDTVVLLYECGSCHGDPVGNSGISTCYGCHAIDNSIGVHPEANPWIAPGKEGFHGTLIEGLGSTESCAECHGEEYDGGWAQVACADCHGGGASGHAALSDWYAPESADFHGARIWANGPQDCTAACHGVDLQGGWTGVGCFTACHSAENPWHPEAADVWMVETDPGFHGAYVNENGFEDCANCHGEDYWGGSSGVTCYGCHNGPNG